MAVDYLLYTLPRRRAFRPEPAQLVELVDELVAREFLPPPDDGPARRGPTLQGPGVARQVSLPLDAARLAPLLAGDVALKWSMYDFEEAGVRYPFDAPPAHVDACYTLELHVSPDYVYLGHTNTIGPLGDTACASCGTELVRDDPFDSPLWLGARLCARCPSCGSETDLGARSAEHTSFDTGMPLPPLPGGLAYRFGLVIDCHKSHPKDVDRSTRANFEILYAMEKVLGEELESIGVMN